MGNDSKPSFVELQEAVENAGAIPSYTPHVLRAEEQQAKTTGQLVPSSKIAQHYALETSSGQVFALSVIQRGSPMIIAVPLGPEVRNNNTYKAPFEIQPHQLAKLGLAYVNEGPVSPATVARSQPFVRKPSMSGQ